MGCGVSKNLNQQAIQSERELQIMQTKKDEELKKKEGEGREAVAEAKKEGEPELGEEVQNEKKREVEEGKIQEAAMKNRVEDGKIQDECTEDPAGGTLTQDSSKREEDKLSKKSLLPQLEYPQMPEIPPANSPTHHENSEIDHDNVELESITSFLNTNAGKFLENVSGFIKSRNAVEKDAEDCLPRHCMDQFQSFTASGDMAQQNVGGGKASSIDELMQVATKALIIFKELILEIVDSAGLNHDDEVMYNGIPLILDEQNRTPWRVLTLAPLKGLDRCQEKVKNEYDDDWSRLVDVIRCSIVVQTEETLEKVAKSMAATNDPRYSLMRLKNRFKEPLFNGYRDALYSLAVRVNGVRHVCEVQLHLAAILYHKHESHKYYEYFRSYFGGKVESAEPRMKLLEAMGESREGACSMAKKVLSGSNAKQLEAFAELTGDEKMGSYQLLVAVERRRLQLVYKGGQEEVVAKMRLADALRLMCTYDEAELLYKECLVARKMKLGEDHVDTLMTKSNLAILLDKQDKAVEAEQLYRECLSSYQKKLGDDHPQTLNCMNHLAIYCKNHGNFVEAEVLYTACLAMQRNSETIGIWHPQTLMTMNNLTVLLKNQGKNRYGDIAQLYRECLDAQTKTLGIEHPDTLLTMSNLAVFLNDYGQVKEAEELYRQSWKARKLTLGDKHRSTLTSMHNFAVFLNEQRKYDEAEPILREYLAVYKKIYHANKLDILMAMHTLANVLKNQGNRTANPVGREHAQAKHDEAEELYRECLVGYRKMSGDKHPDTLKTMNNLANLLKTQKKNEEAEALFREGLAARKETLGEKHPDTLLCKSNFARFLDENQEKYDEAETLYMECLEERMKTLDKNDPKLLSSMFNMAVFLQQERSNYADAEALARECVSGYKELRGEDHADTQDAVAILNLCLKKQAISLHLHQFRSAMSHWDFTYFQRRVRQ